MAACAIVGDPNVGHRRTREIGELGRSVAGLASQAGRQMVTGFGDWRHTGEHLTVMTACTTVEDPGVNHRSARKIGELGRSVAGLARQAGRQVVARLGYRSHTGKYLAVMTACTTVEDSGVNHRSARKIGELGRSMASLASQTGRQVIARLGYRSHTGKYLTVMTACTTADDAGVVHRCTGEIGELGRRVAGLASQAGRQVVARFRYRRHANKHLTVVAGRATADDPCMVHHA